MALYRFDYRGVPNALEYMMTMDTAVNLVHLHLLVHQSDFCPVHQILMAAKISQYMVVWITCHMSLGCKRPC